MKNTQEHLFWGQLNFSPIHRDPNCLIWQPLSREITRDHGRLNISKNISGDTYIFLASTNLLTQEMLTLLGIVLRRWNGLKRCQTLDIAIIGNLRRSPRRLPKYGIYVTAEGHGLNIFTRDLQTNMRQHQFFNILQAHHHSRSCASMRGSLEKCCDLETHPRILFYSILLI